MGYSDLIRERMWRFAGIGNQLCPSDIDVCNDADMRNSPRFAYDCVLPSLDKCNSLNNIDAADATANNNVNYVCDITCSAVVASCCAVVILLTTVAIVYSQRNKRRKHFTPSTWGSNINMNVTVPKPISAYDLNPTEEQTVKPSKDMIASKVPWWVTDVTRLPPIYMKDSTMLLSPADINVIPPSVVPSEGSLPPINSPNIANEKECTTTSAMPTSTDQNANARTRGIYELPPFFAQETRFDSPRIYHAYLDSIATKFKDKDKPFDKPPAFYTLIDEIPKCPITRAGTVGKCGSSQKQDSSQTTVLSTLNMADDSNANSDPFRFNRNQI